MPVVQSQIYTVSHLFLIVAHIIGVIKIPSRLDVVAWLQYQNQGRIAMIGRLKVIADTVVSHRSVFF